MIRLSHSYNSVEFAEVRVIYGRSTSELTDRLARLTINVVIHHLKGRVSEQEALKATNALLHNLQKFKQKLYTETLSDQLLVWYTRIA